MDETRVGLVEAVFGVLVDDGHYEAFRGVAGFRGGKLVALQVGRAAPQEDDAGLTAGFTLLADLSAALAGRGPSVSRAVTRVYVNGALDSETDLGDVQVSTDPS
jgi:hypothetical protein